MSDQEDHEMSGLTAAVSERAKRFAATFGHGSRVRGYSSFLFINAHCCETERLFSEYMSRAPEGLKYLCRTSSML